MEMGSSLEVSNNLFQAAQRKDITFIKLSNFNQVNVSNNYMEISSSSEPQNNIGIEIDNLSGAIISQIRSQGYFQSIVRVLNSYSTKIESIIYSPLGHKIPAIIENRHVKRVKKLTLDISPNSVISSSGVRYIDNTEGVTFIDDVDNKR